MKNLFNLNPRSKVTCYSCDEASLTNEFISIDRNSESGRDLEVMLAKAAKVDKSKVNEYNNHTVYAVKYGEDQAMLYLWCYDKYIYIGTKIKFNK